MKKHKRAKKKILPKSFVTPERTAYHAEILANRVMNRFRHFRKRFKRERIECFRLYDWDIKEVRAVVDWYAGHIVVAEYERLQTGPDWIVRMAEAVGKALELPPENVHIKRRRTNTKEGPRYEKVRMKKRIRLKVAERDLTFWVNLDDFLDTGLFSDHRNTRLIVRQISEGKHFLNLFAYTGAFTCAAAAGGAQKLVTVDRSKTYLKWARDNLQVNNLWNSRQELVQSDVSRYLLKAQKAKKRFDLAVVDPPSFFKDQTRKVSFDISRDHPELLKSVLKVMAPGGIVFFSTNHQRFEPKLEALPVKGLQEVTPKTIPEDYRNRHVHRCWQMTAV